jgi:hypothetical protein
MVFLLMRPESVVRTPNNHWDLPLSDIDLKIDHRQMPFMVETFTFRELPSPKVGSESFGPRRFTP